MCRVLGIDYGDVRIGIAISDEEQQFAFEYGIWPAAEFWQRIGSFITEQGIAKIALGLPLNMRGEETKTAAAVRKFAARLSKEYPHIAVALVDERLSSKMAHSIGEQAGKKNPDKGVDSLAAQIVLETYLARQHKNNNNHENT